MLSVLFSSFLLLAVCVIIHSMGIALLLRFSRHHTPAPERHPWIAAFFVVRLAWWLIALHLLQIFIWAGYFRVRHLLPDFETALYFSGVSYSTLGYGDVVLPRPWRTLGAAEGLTGILMCGLSTGLFVAICLRILEARASHRTNK